MRKGKILAGAGLALLSAAVLWGCQDRETISPLENGEADEVCEIAIENLTLGTKYPDTEAVEELINEITVPAISVK